MGYKFYYNDENNDIEAISNTIDKKIDDREIIVKISFVLDKVSKYINKSDSAKKEEPIVFKSEGKLFVDKNTRYCNDIKDLPKNAKTELEIVTAILLAYLTSNSNYSEYTISDIQYLLCDINPNNNVSGLASRIIRS